MAATLIFPGGMPGAIDYMKHVAVQGKRVIGASSVANDPAVSLYPQWEFLPYVNDPQFEAAFLSLLQKEKVDTVQTAHPVIGRYLKSLIAAQKLQLTLVAHTFSDTTIENLKMLRRRVQQANATPFLIEAEPSHPRLTEVETAAVMHHALHIEGQSSEEKILALMEVLRHCPKGDLVEIGCLFGRSAFVLSWLAKRYGIGALLCLDPWKTEAAFQAETSDFVNEEVRDWDFEQILGGFILNLLPYNHGHINYIQGGAHESHARYAKAPLEVASEAFGTTRYTGKIACLHIDGNHDLKHITQDIADWVPHVVPGGWIIIDDYQWAFGDGPQKASDAWMEENRARIAQAFVTGSALFVQLHHDR